MESQDRLAVVASTRAMTTVYKDHLRDPKVWSLYTGGLIHEVTTVKEMSMEICKLCGLYIQVVFIYRCLDNGFDLVNTVKNMP